MRCAESDDESLLEKPLVAGTGTPGSGRQETLR
jgi:hypothetical protein